MATAAQAWSAAANGYTDQATQVTSQGGEALLKLVETLRPLEEGSSVLDSGAGNGALTHVLAQRCPNMSIIATDIAPKMLENLRSRKIPNVTTLILDATKDHVSQGLPPRSFTHALSTFMLQFIPTPQRAVNEMYRVLAPGGIIALSIWTKNALAEPWNIACLNLDPDFKPNESAFSAAWKSCEDLEQGLLKAGFVDVQSEETTLEMVFKDAEEYADYYITAKNPAFLMMQSTWKGEAEDVREELVKVTREQFGNGRIEMVAANVVGRRPLETPPLGSA